MIKTKEPAKNMKIILTIIMVIIFLIWQNNHISVSKYIYKNEKLPKGFNGFKILHISDLHNKTFGKNQRYILGKIKSLSPDIIVITGDLVDRRRFDLEKALEFVKGAMDIVPVYYVPGNHEAWSGKYDVVREELKRLDIRVLENEKLRLDRENSSIEILGLMDPGFYSLGHKDRETRFHILEEKLNKLKNDSEFQILLSHRPELLDLYVAANMDMIFAGHAHGGQFRIPGLGGLVAPEQGFFPKYTSGSHTRDNSTLYISRGLGNSIIPIRIFNRPEIVLVKLED
ncbi:MAG: metallophosphoesterase [Tissierellaceae bacterium]|nr:metallophosphoesterase [Tissierellaceae bacterium]